MRSFNVKENNIGTSFATDIKKLTALYNRIMTVKWNNYLVNKTYS